MNGSIQVGQIRTFHVYWQCLWLQLDILLGSNIPYMFVYSKCWYANCIKILHDSKLCQSSRVGHVITKLGFLKSSLERAPFTTSNYQDTMLKMNSIQKLKFKLKRNSELKLSHRQLGSSPIPRKYSLQINHIWKLCIIFKLPANLKPFCFWT